jgi:outer membrane protein OmpA-like peptidoglycan-associated protein
MKLAHILASFVAVGLIAYEKQLATSPSVAVETQISTSEKSVEVEAPAPAKPAFVFPAVAELISKAKEFMKSEAKPENVKPVQVVKVDANELKAELTKLDALGASAVLNVSPSAIEIELPVRVSYVKGSASLRTQVREQLGKFARYVGALNPNFKFEITYAGHVADQLSPEFRVQRADRVAAAIRDSGIQALRIGLVQQVVLKDESPRDVASAGPNSSKSPHILVRVRTAD